MRRIVICLHDVVLKLLLACALVAVCSTAWAGQEYREELIFPLHPQHNHAPGIVECPNGDLLVSWYRGSGERSADDVAVLGARLVKGDKTWSQSFVMADFPNFPDCNTCMMIDKHKKLWLFWPIILDNHWESALTNYRTSKDYSGAGVPKWDWQGTIWLKPADFKDKAMSLLNGKLAELQKSRATAKVCRVAGKEARRKALATHGLAAALQADHPFDRAHPAAAV